VAIEVDITGLGSQGDGIAQGTDDVRYVPFALPGERMRIAADGASELLSPPSPDRREPICRHFGVCGGCSAQHMGDRLYPAWKRGIVVEAFRQHGLAPDVRPLQLVQPHTRRRAVLTFRRHDASRSSLGYHRRKSTDLVDLQECPVLSPGIAGALAALRALATALPGAQARMTVLSTPVGLDVSIEQDTSRLAGSARVEIGRIAARPPFARVTVNGEVLIEQQSPTLSFGGVAIVPPPGAFVQAVEAAELSIAQRVLEAVGKSRRVADLFCGVGTFTLPLARNSRVLALDSDQAAVEAVAAGVRRAQGLKPVATRVRDLLHQPLSPKELEEFDAVVFDPPRSGAREQAARLARSRVPLVVAVSCDPGTLARDARILADGGYGIECVTPIDQFLYSAHVEAVAVLRRTG
jgi:23S rRNA (uracil1939-C5)-methyltransferase